MILPDRRIDIAAVCACLLGLSSLAACHKAQAQHDSSAQGPPTAASEARDIRVGPELEQQLVVGKVPSQVVADTVEVAGRVEADENREALVGTPVAGRITELLVREGDSVEKGQVLATVSSTDLTNAQFAFLRAYSQMQLSGSAVDRAQQLLAAGVIGTAELQRRQAELSQNTAEVEAARGELKVLGMPEDAAEALERTRKVNSVSQIVASIGGIILERKATIGQVVQPADTIFMIADLSSVWLAADVPEETAGSLAQGEYAEAEIASLLGYRVRGQLSHIHSMLNPETRTVRVHMDVANPQRRLKPAMLATMTLQQNQRRERVLPLTAIVREDNREFVFVKTGQDERTGQDRFDLRQVSLGGEYGEMRVLTGGVESGEQIVLDGAFHLNNERKRLQQQGSRPQGG